MRRTNTWFVLIGLALALGACSKKQELKVNPDTNTPVKPLKPSQAGKTRAKLVKNLSMKAELKSAIEAQIDGGLCAQEVIPSTGDYFGESMVEISQGPCPATGLVDDTKAKVVQLIVFQSTGSGAEIDLRDLEYAERAGRVQWSTTGDSATAVQLNTLCTDDDDLCYFRVENRKFTGIEMY